MNGVMPLNINESSLLERKGSTALYLISWIIPRRKRLIKKRKSKCASI